jgi:predicted ABC-type transport system involved in lysophospholipase L1 biosynthesis ATPase subunit
MKLNQTHDSALVVVTHSPEIAGRFGRQLVMKGGALEG